MPTSVESICSILTCTSNEYFELYDNRKLFTDVLSDDALHVVTCYCQELRAADQRYHLDNLLSAMLAHAPHPDGKRYVAVSIHVARQKGHETVIELAKAWMEYLFLPMLTFSQVKTSMPSGSETPTNDGTTRSGQGGLREAVALREQHYCAITRTFDLALVYEMLAKGQEDKIPDVPHRSMNAAHIIPYPLNNFNDSITSGLEMTDIARTLDMFQSWTQIDIGKLIGSKIDSPENAIFMTSDDYTSFGRFLFYFDKDAYPDNINKYKVRMVRNGLRLSNGPSSADADFRSLAESGIEPPDPEFLRVHAAFAKVLHFSGGGEYSERIRRDVGRTSIQSDFASILIQKLQIVVH